MSYEGYYVALCAQGHCRRWDASMEDPPSCHCGAAFVYRFGVDETNGADHETGLCPGEEKERALRIATPAETHQCSCGNVHQVREETYVLPGQP